MSEMESCEYCKEQIHCRNLYVALKILEEELRFARRDDLWREFAQLKKDVNNSGFAYPEGSTPCSLAKGQQDARVLLRRADEILREVRRTLSISPA